MNSPGFGIGIPLAAGVVIAGGPGAGVDNLLINATDNLLINATDVLLI